METVRPGPQTDPSALTKLKMFEAEAMVRRLLSQWVGENIARPGLIDTPKRWCKAMREMTAGYRMDPKAILATRFPADHDEMIVLTGIRFTSLCEHHLMPFFGTATIGYIPDREVIGISKLVRLTACFARRLQIQERMTDQIALALDECLEPRGCGVIVEARHECMSCRGVKQSETAMVTTALKGAFLNPSPRAEFLGYARGNRGR